MTERLYHCIVPAPVELPANGLGIDAGMTLTKMARVRGDMLEMHALPTDEVPSAGLNGDRSGETVGVTGARGAMVAGGRGIESLEIDAAVRGVRLLLAGSDGGGGEFMLVLLGTGTAFAAVRGETVLHLGGTPLGGGSFASIARAVQPTLTYGAMIAAAARGDRTRADMMVSDAYPGGIGRIGPDMTAAHLAKKGGSLDDFLAGLLNLHGENIAQIAAQRALLQKITRMVLCGGFVHENAKLMESIAFMSGLFGVKTVLAPHPGFAGAIGAMVLAAESAP